MYSEEILNRFWVKIDIRKPNECWNWEASTRGRKKLRYGQFKLGGKMILAHRLAWSIINGPIPEGKLILHTCDNSLCCNPDHLYCGTWRDNMRDRSDRDRIPLIPPEICAAGKSKLYAGEIWLIRRLKVDTPDTWRTKERRFSQNYVAKMFKISQSVISKIWNSEKVLCREGYYC